MPVARVKKRAQLRLRHHIEVRARQGRKQTIVACGRSSEGVLVGVDARESVIFAVVAPLLLRGRRLFCGVNIEQRSSQAVWAVGETQPALLVSVLSIVVVVMVVIVARFVLGVRRQVAAEEEGWTTDTGCVEINDTRIQRCLLQKIDMHAHTLAPAV